MSGSEQVRDHGERNYEISKYICLWDFEEGVVRLSIEGFGFGVQCEMEVPCQRFADVTEKE